MKNCNYLNHFLKKTQSYRPISLLPLLSKVIERNVHEQTENFLSRNKIIERFQLGFWKNNLQNICLGNLTDKITTRFKKGLSTGINLIDLQKAFDTIEHQILLKKLKYLGFSKMQLHDLNPVFVMKS